jgi:hypothetical protein
MLRGDEGKGFSDGLRLTRGWDDPLGADTDRDVIEERLAAEREREWKFQ